MRESDATTCTKGIEPEKSSMPDRTYTCVMVAVAAFLLSLAFFRPAGGPVAVEATMRYQRAESKDDLSREVENALSSPTEVEKALEKIHPDVRRSALPDGGWDAWQDQYVPTVSFVTAAGAAEAPIYRVRLSGEHDSFQIQLLTHLLHQFQQVHDHPIDAEQVAAEYEKVRQQVAQAIEQVDASQAEADLYLNERLAEVRQEFEEQLQQMMDEGSPVADADGPAPSASLSLPPLPDIESMGAVDNPYIASPNGKAPTTEDSAIVREAKNLDADARPSERFSTDSGRWPRFDETEARRTLQDEPEYQQLIAQIESARLDHNAALDRLADAVEPTKSVSERVELVEAPHVAERRHALTASRFAWLLIPSLFLGAVCAWFRQESDPPEAFISPRDAEEWLELPAVGAITTSDGPRIPAQDASTASPTVLWIRRAAEFTICAAIVVVIIAIATISGFAGDLLQDPFAAYMQAVDHLSGWLT